MVYVWGVNRHSQIHLNTTIIYNILCYGICMWVLYIVRTDTQIYFVRFTALSTSSWCWCWSAESAPGMEDVLFSSSNDLTIILVATFNESSNVNVDLRLERFLFELISSFVYRWSSCSIRCSMLLSKLASGVAFGILFAYNITVKLIVIFVKCIMQWITKIYFKSWHRLNNRYTYYTD